MLGVVFMATMIRGEQRDRAEEFSIRQARQIVHPYFRHRPWIYWTDMLLTTAVGYGAAAMYLEASLWSWQQILFLTIAGFALFRTGSFIHEITHMRHGEMLAFRTGWNLLCGIPMLMPSFFYENHIDHHKANHYGTLRDGEYLPLGTSSWHHLVLFLAQVPVLPLYILVRFLLSPVTFLRPHWRQWALEHTSSFVLNFRHRLTIPAGAPRRIWAMVETACFLRAVLFLAVVAVGVYDWTRLVQLYVLAMVILGLNYNRNLVAHHYRNTGGEMTHEEQLEDSVNITGGLWTELFFPLGLRYHALHHLFPSLPYHNLGKAHRALLAELPAGSPYHRTIFPSYWSVLGELLADTRRASARDRAGAVA